MPHKPDRRIWLAMAQLALGIGLVTFLFLHMEDRADVLNALRSIARRWPFGVGAILCFLGCLTFATERWKRILAAHGMPLSFAKTFELSLIGQFFNAFMFGAVGGDAIKAFIVARVFSDRKTEAVTTIFIDRMIGMLALIGLATAVLLVRLKFFLRYPETRTVAYALCAALLLTLAVLFMAFRRNIFEQFPAFRTLELRSPLGGILSRIYRAFHACLTHRGLLTATLLLSLVNHLLLILGIFLLGLGLQIRTVPQIAPPRPAVLQAVAELGTYLTVFPVVNGIASVPATPGGLGTRDAAAKFLLGVSEFNVPSSRAVTLSLLTYAVTLFWSLAGGIVYAAGIMKRRAVCLHPEH